MYGAILGDIIGAPYEFGTELKTKDFPLFCRESRFTDDTVMTIAVCQALLRFGRMQQDVSSCTVCQEQITKENHLLQQLIAEEMQKWGRKFPDAGYGGNFINWIYSDNPKAYNSFGNGSAMRVSSVGWFYDSIEDTRYVAALTAAVTHNHLEGIKGAEAIAAAIYMARTGYNKKDIVQYITGEFGYDLQRTCNEIRPQYSFDVSCQGTVPEAIICFLEAADFEDCIRNAISLGGDADTLTCIAAGIAEAYYGVPTTLVKECRNRLPQEMIEILDEFATQKQKKCDKNSVIFT